MKNVFIASAFAATLLAAPSAVEAREYRWCAQYDFYNYNCGFDTFAQCLATISGIGGHCRENLRYAGPPPRQQKPRRQH